MNAPPTPSLSPPPPRDPLRMFLLLILLVGMVGTGAELLLIGHYEEWQLPPLILLALGLLTVGLHGMKRRPWTLRLLQGAMGLFIVSGVAGLYLHYDGNTEFEREMDPALGGFALFSKAMTGATPILAPGMMIQLGLIGFAYAFRHPLLATRSKDRSTSPPPNP